MLETTQDIIDAFEVYIGDATVLSSTDELALVEKIYREILEMHQWEFLKTEATGSVNGTTIAQPADFARLCTPPVIYFGDNNNPFQVVPYTERRNYTNQNNYAYYDAANEQFVLTQSKSDDYSFDYIYTPDALTTSGSNPVWPARFNYAILHLMCTDSDIIELSEKARAYYDENMAKGMAWVQNMRNWSDSLSNYVTYGV